MRFMIVDDNPVDIELIERSLAAEFKDVDYTEVVRADEFDRALGRDGYDIVFTDYRLAWTDGLKVLKEVRRRYPATPVIMVTDSGNEEVAVEAMEAGLSDYILKNHLEPLPRRAAEKIEQARMARERDEAYLALRQAEERYRAVSESTTDYVVAYSVDSKGALKRDWVTAGFARLTGYTEEEASLGRREFIDMIYPPDRPDVETGLKRLRAGETVTIETRIVAKDGSIRWLRYFMQPVWNLSAARVDRVIGGAREITGEKEGQEALLASEAKFRAVAELSTAAIFIIQGTKYVYENQAAQELTGYTPAEISALDFWEIVHPDFRETVKARSVARMKGEKVPSRYELLIVDKRGQEKWLDYSGALITFQGGPAILGSAVDITEKKLRLSEEKQRERDIRRAYVDVFAAVTGGRLIIMTAEEIDAALGRPLGDEIEVATYENIKEAREAVKEIAAETLPGADSFGLMAAAVEALTNAVKHGGGGRIRVYSGDGRVQIAVSDSGPGIDFSLLPKSTLTAGFSTKQSLGMGFGIMLNECDRVLLATEPTGTTVVLEKGRSSQAAFRR